MNKRLEGKVALVTGSTLGIGKAIALRFLAEGAKLIVNSHKHDQDARALCDQLGSEDALFIKADISEAGEVQEMVEIGTKRFGPINVLINNAGVDVFSDPLKMTTMQWERCFGVDLDGAWNCCRAVLPGMLAVGSGSIVNIASVHGHRIIPGSFPYPVAKHALIGLTRSLGIEYAARGIRVNSISPGLILTERVQAWLDASPDPAGETLRQTNFLPCKRIGQPDEVAYTALFLASDEARFINASDILIDGGRSQLYHE